ncbi:MAG: hypothetical protein LC777_21515, partial [Actinobacteria bacterium]|nr:hypothetical protein [Actinomycetota bacterium]
MATSIPRVAASASIRSIWWLLAVHERDPVALVAGVAPLALVKDAGDHLGGVAGDGRGQPLACGLRPLAGVVAVAGQDVCGGARDGRRVVDGADLRDPLAVALLPFGEPVLELAGRSLRLLAGRRPERVGAHHDPLPVAGDHQRVTAPGRSGPAGRVEGLEVARRPPGEQLQLALADRLAGVATDR